MQERLSRLPIRATIVYALLAAAWIAASDRAVAALELGETAQTLKGWAFVLISSLALYTTLRTLTGQIRRTEPGFDSLTRLPNRAMFTKQLGDAVERARPDGRGVAVLTLGLDRFRHLNDTLGPGSGDEALVTMVGRLESTLRATDVLARIGGDEFGILQQSIRGASDVSALGERVLRSIASPFAVRGRELRLTASLGVALFPADGQTADDLLKSSDLALARAKQEGGNTFRFFVPSMDAAVRERAGIESGLHRAIEDEQFLLHYQPQIDLKTGAVIGVEALLRWNRPGEGILTPGRFLPIAEELGLIRMIGDWVLRTAVKRGEHWHRKGIPFHRIAVNLSFNQFRQRDLDRTVTTLLADSGLPPAMLELELTESALAQDADRAIDLLRKLHGAGVSLAIDDFGTGYSSLSYLRQFEVDHLKIDKSFVAGIGRDPGAEKIIRAIIGLAGSMDLRTLGEGVETADQEAFLREAGCDAAQGYHFSVPLDEPDLLQFLQRTAAA
ncbi:MAG: domain S-box protein [Gemmatimonadetes bacterium]|nr:domain S-box protein [Gemmatimonadota bacterium]